MADEKIGAVGRQPLKIGSSFESIKAKSRVTYYNSSSQSRFLNLFHRRTRIDFLDVKNEKDLITLEDVQKLGKEIAKKSENLENQLKTLTKAFAMGSCYVDVFLASDLALRSLIGYLTGNDCKLQIHAVYCVTNITANDMKRWKFVAKSCAPYLIAFLGSQNDLMQDLSACALGNIAAHSDASRHLLKMQGILKPLVELFKVNSPAVIESAAYTTIKMCEGRDDVTAELISLGIKPLLTTCFDIKELNLVIIGELSWLLLFLTSNELQAKEMLEAGTLKIVLKHLHKMSDSISQNFYTATPLIRILGNAISIVDVSLLVMLEKDVLLATMIKYCDCKIVHVVKETLWAFSNLFAVSEEFAWMAIQYNVLETFIKYIDWDHDIKTEVLTCLCTLASHGTRFINKIIAAGVLPFLVKSDAKEKAEFRILNLQLIELILRSADQRLDIFRTEKGESYVDGLLNDSNNLIRNISHDLKMKYFS